jgi:predicted ester cyclase
MFSSQAAAQTRPECPSKGRDHDRVERSNTELVRHFHEAINRQDWTTADRLVSSDYRHYVTAADGFRAIAWDGFKRGNRHLRSAFPDWTNKIIQTIAEGDKVAVILQGRGTHRGSVAGETATGRAATLPIMTVHQVCRGKLIADWEFVDVGPLMASLKAP